MSTTSSGTSGPASVALAHDYLTQFGGAERVVLSMLAAFPGAPLHTSLFVPADTFPEFGRADVRPMAINRIPGLPRRHRLALPLLASSFSAVTVDAPLVLCSSSGWSHGIGTTGRKVVYCHTPARWLYQGPRYLGEEPAPGARSALSLLGPALRRWDRRAAATAQRYLVNSTAVRTRVQDIYRREAEVLPPPPALGPDHPQRPVEGVEPGYWLCVSRLLPYKNVDAVAAAFEHVGHERLVVAGQGPDGSRLRAAAPPNVTFVGRVDDDQLAWLYAHSRAVVAASHEDYGLTPVEGASFGRPAAVLAWGGFLDTVQAGRTGVFFDEPTPRAVAEAVKRLVDESWCEADIIEHARAFGPDRFVARLQGLVAEELALV
jgi:glycosyltransferase involved in cell wall biosynthesis